jgi:hypothetical protein
MDHHLQAVASRALIVAGPPKNREFKDILASYASETRPTAKPAKRHRQ